VYAKNELKSTADFKGLKFRTYNPVTSRFAELLGAVPTTVQAPEISQAFATGIANTMITSGSTGIDTQAWEYAKYYYDLRAMHNKSLTFVNAAAFKALDPALQKVVLEAAARAEKRGWEMAAKSGDDSAAVLASKGMLVQPGSPQLVAGLKAVGGQIAEEWSKKAGPDGEAILKALR
jgi:TRAP-type C4-dicarboxylate transport system substrate-binding protein